MNFTIITLSLNEVQVNNYKVKIIMKKIRNGINTIVHQGIRTISFEEQIYFSKY